MMYDEFDGPPEYDYCRPNIDPDFGLHRSLMSIAYSGCDVNKLAYKACKHEEKIFNNSIMVISNNLGCTFDAARPCAICGKTGHTFEDCKELQDLAAIRKSYIQLRVALQKIKGMAASQGRDVNLLRSYKLSYVNSVDLLLSSSHQDTAAANRLDKLEGLLAKSIKFADQTNKKINSLTS